ncbi:unnamed protein product, partial [Iphiclides podalirius]
MDVIPGHFVTSSKGGSLILVGEGDGCLHLVIASVTSEALVQNESDDDVIEVVRDEAPIEILSDGEEMEAEKSKVNVTHEFHFADLAGAENMQDTNECTNLDPLTNSSIDEDRPVNVTECNETTTPAPESFKDNAVGDQESELTVAELVWTTPNSNYKGAAILGLGSGATLVEKDGRSVLMIGGNRFMRHYISRHGRTRWRCCRSFNRCRAIAITWQNRIVKLNNQHNH